jgi:hypothetical protein
LFPWIGKRSKTAEKQKKAGCAVQESTACFFAPGNRNGKSYQQFLKLCGKLSLDLRQNSAKVLIQRENRRDLSTKEANL